MREMMTFYKKQIEECKGLARQSSSRIDKAFWDQAAERWAAILQQYEKPSVAKNMKDGLIHAGSLVPERQRKSRQRRTVGTFLPDPS
jgi:hypothetical protein